ncbi:MAG: carboxypeptidase-like regulatory domain-containing protein [Planctomycetota bacterium]
MNSTRTLTLLALALFGGLALLALGPKACSGPTERRTTGDIIPLTPPAPPKVVFDPRDEAEITAPETVDDGEWRVATVELAPEALADEGTASVLVTVRDQNGRVLPRAVVGMTGPGGQSVFGIREKSGGTRRFEKLSPGPWTILAYADAKQRTREEIELRPTDFERPIALVLRASNLIDVEFRGEDGRPLRDVLTETPHPPF